MQVGTIKRLVGCIAGMTAGLLLLTVAAGTATAADNKTGAPSVATARPKARQKAVRPPARSATDRAGATKKQAAAAASPGSADAKNAFVTIDFDNVEIGLFIKYISELTGKNFVVDKAVRGNVTIISPTRISANEAYAVFESVLEVQGFTTVPAGSIIKIIPAVEARSKNIETGLHRQTDEITDKVVTQLIPLQYADPNELKKVFAPLVSKTSVVIAYPATRMLIVTDVLSNIQRLLGIIKEIDVPEIGEVITLLPLQNATANEVAKSLNALFQKSSASSRVQVRQASRNRGKATPASRTVASTPTTVKILPDERTNLLIVLASPEDTEQVKELVALLDREVPRGAGNIQVYYLQNANAEDLAKVLTALPTKKNAQVAKGKAPVLSGDVLIVADKATNSLVITAKKADYLVLEDVIQKLDIPRNMVYLEALIMEVNVKKDFVLGVEWLGGFAYGEDSGVAFGGSRAGDASSIGSMLASTTSLESATLSKGLSMGVIGETITIGTKVFPSIAAVLEAYKADSDVRIISNPQILTTDNEEAEIKVGENVPYITSKNTTSSSQDYTNYEYKDVGVTLKITPQINQEGVVRLQIFTEVVKISDPEAAASGTPTTLKRTASTTVIVKDANTVVIGGIIGDDQEEGTYKVPLLGDIPLLGYLFRSHSSGRKRTNLYIFITPRIIRNPGEATRIYREKKAEAILRHEQGFSDEAFEQLPGIDSNDDLQLAELGYNHLQAGEYDQAKTYLTKALQINPDNPYALINMGVIYEEEGRIPLAAAMYERVIALNPTDKAGSSTDAASQGQSLADVARGNLEALQGKEDGDAGR